MRTVLVAAIVAALVVAGFAVVAIAQEEPADDRPPPAGPIGEVLDGLVADGVLDAGQAEAVLDALTERLAAAPHRAFGIRGPHGHLAAAADAIGVDTADLVAALRDGSTLAEIAEDNGVDPGAVVDALVAAFDERLDDAVANGRITADQADRLRERNRERAGAIVAGEWPERPDVPPFPHHGRGPRGFAPFGGPGHFGPPATDTGTS